MQKTRRPFRRLTGVLLTALLGVALLVAAGCGGASAPAAQQAAPAAPATQQPPAAPAATAAPAAQQPQAAPAATTAPAVPKLAQKHKVIIGTLRIATNAAFFAAQENGHFDRFDIDAEFVFVDTASKTTIPLGTGDMHVVGGSLSGGLFNANAKDVEILIVADKGKQTISDGKDLSSMRLAVRKDLWDQGVRKVADLKGKTVGINARGSGSEFQLVSMLKKAGLTIDDVKIAQLGFPNMPAAMENKSIDAGMMLEPFATAAKGKGFTEWVTSTAEAYANYQSGVILYSGKWARENPDAANRFMAAYLAGQRDYETARRLGPGSKEHDRMAEIIAKYVNQKPEQVKAGTWAFLDPTGMLNLQSVMDELDWNVAAGIVKVKPDTNKMLNHSYVDWANKVLGEYQPPKK